MRRGSADSIRASGQDPASTGRIQNCNLPSPSCQRRTLRTGRRPYKLHEDAEGRGRLSHGVRERGGRRGTPAALHRQLQREAPALGSRLLEPQPLRGGTAPQAGQIISSHLSDPRGPLQSICKSARASGCRSGGSSDSPYTKTLLNSIPRLTRRLAATGRLGKPSRQGWKRSVPLSGQRNPAAACETRNVDAMPARSERRGLRRGRGVASRTRAAPLPGAPQGETGARHLRGWR